MTGTPTTRSLHTDERPAALILDLQHGMRSLLAPAVLDQLVPPVNQLVGLARDRGWPVVWMTTRFSPDYGDLASITVDRPFTPNPVDGDPAALWAGLEVDRGDLQGVKRQTGAFVGTDLELQLRRRRCTSLVIGGVLTSQAVESTARAAADLGFHPVVASDAVADVEAAEHDRAIAHSLPRIGRCRAVADLARDTTTGG